jgi:hypothetical protein
MVSRIRRGGGRLSRSSLPAARCVLGAEADAAAGRVGRAAQVARRVSLDEYQDDPDGGVFWGPPGVDGVPQRWSRAWFDWRAER